MCFQIDLNATRPTQRYGYKVMIKRRNGRYYSAQYCEAWRRGVQKKADAGPSTSDLGALSKYLLAMHGIYVYLDWRAAFNDWIDVVAARYEELKKKGDRAVLVRVRVKGWRHSSAPGQRLVATYDAATIIKECEPNSNGH